MRTRLIITVVTAIALAGCATGQSQSPAESGSPAASPTPVASTAPDPSPSGPPSALPVKVHFDGTDCTYLGPEVFPDGTPVLFQLSATPAEVDHVALQVIGVTSDVPADVLEKTYEDTSWMVVPHMVMQLGPGDAYFTMTYRDPDEIAVLVYCMTNRTPDLYFPAALLWVVPK